jgi:NADPH2:quinone reductase
MRAWQVVRHGAPSEALELAEQVPPPTPGPGFLRVRVAAAALGLPDVFMCRGSYALTPKLPFTPGQELAGVVTAAGPGCRARAGERVMAVSGFFLGHGSFAEEALALDDFCFAVPDWLADADAAALLIPFHTAWVGLVRRGQLRAGETLLVLGASGGTGSAAVQMGRALGARVLATAGGPAKAEFCRSLGADVVIDHRTEDIAARVREVTGGRGADVIYDPVGGEAFEAATRAIAHEGRLLLVGFASGRWGTPNPAHVVTNNYSVVGVIPSGYDRAFKQEAQDWLLPRFQSGALRVPIASRHAFAALPEALAALERSEVAGRSVVSVPV